MVDLALELSYLLFLILHTYTTKNILSDTQIYIQKNTLHSRLNSGLVRL